MDRRVPQVFEESKMYFSSSPMLKQEKNVTLYVYLAIVDRVVNSILLKENETKAHKLIYYVSKALVGAKLRYSRLERLLMPCTSQRIS